jgi:membrane protease YdiL (CAAX protease family)
MSIVKNMIQYLARPHMPTVQRRFAFESVINLIKLMGVAFLMLPVIGLFLGMVIQLSGATLPKPSAEFEAFSAKPNFIFLAVLAAPLIEELLFRSWLTRRWGILIVMPLLLIGVALLALLGADSDIISDGVQMLILAAMLGSFALYLYRFVPLSRQTAILDHTINSIFPYVFWGSCILFGLVHLANYEAGDMGVLLPLIILPQFVVGVMLGFIRMRFGLISAMVFHGLYNLSLLTFFALLGQAAP